MIRLEAEKGICSFGSSLPRTILTQSLSDLNSFHLAAWRLASFKYSRFQVYKLYPAAQNLIALTPVRTVVAEADGSDEPVVTTDIGADIWTIEVDEEPELGAVEEEGGRGSVAWAPNRAHAFFHLHCVHHISRCSSP